MTTLTDEHALLAAILATPGDDLPRLVYADWLDEHGRRERAEFIRDCCQVMGQHTDCPVRLRDMARRRPVPLRCGACDYCVARRRAGRYYAAHCWLPGYDYAVCFEPTPLDGMFPDGPGMTLVVRRGFVGYVRGPLSAFWVENCPRCNRGGLPLVGGSHRIRANCPDCSGTGRVVGVTPGFAALVRTQPVERVEVTDADPRWDGTHPGWIRGEVGREGAGESDGYTRGDRLPAGLYDSLSGGTEQEDSVRWLFYPTESAARDALSAALLHLARPTRYPLGED